MTDKQIQEEPGKFRKAIMRLPEEHRVEIHKWAKLLRKLYLKRGIYVGAAILLVSAEISAEVILRKKKSEDKT